MISKFLAILLIISNLNAGKVENDIPRHFIFPHWKGLHKLNKALLHSHAHHAFVDIYSNNIATIPYVKKNSSFPEGSILIKPLFNEKHKEHLSRLVIMVKMHKGYDTEHNDWWYGVYDKTGTTVWFEGKIKSCINCHKLAKKTDYLFCEDVMEQIDFQD